jgi:uroporphyrinogen decarboxylase
VEDKIDNHIHSMNYLLPADTRGKTKNEESVDTGFVVDEFGITWNNERYKNIGDWGMVSHPIKDLDFKGYIWPNGEAPGRFDGIDKEVKLHSNTFNTLAMIGLFDTAWHLTGISDTLMAMADPDPSVINYLLDNSLKYLVDVIRQIPSGLFESVRFLEDWGSQFGLMMGIHNWRKHLKPRLRELYAEVHAKGLYVHSHSCGDNTDVFGDLIELKADISDPLQPEVMDIGKIKEQYGNEITLMGGLPCQSIIPQSSPQEVYEITQKTYELLSKGGRYIFGTAGAFPTETPEENVLAIMDFYNTVKNKGYSG